MNIADKPLESLSDEEWERLCDGCGLCCMHKFEDADTGDMLYTRVACRQFDGASCRCRDYARRQQVAACLQIRGMSAAEMRWLPASCAYRLRAEGRPLPDWHPLVSGDPRSVHAAGISMQGWSVPEQAVPEADWPEHIIALPDA